MNTVGIKQDRPGEFRGMEMQSTIMLLTESDDGAGRGWPEPLSRPARRKRLISRF